MEYSPGTELEHNNQYVNNGTGIQRVRAVITGTSPFYQGSYDIRYYNPRPYGFSASLTKGNLDKNWHILEIEPED